MSRIGYDPNIIVLDNGIWRTDIGNRPGDELVQDYYPKDLRDFGKPEKTDDAKGSTDSSANSEK